MCTAPGDDDQYGSTAEKVLSLAGGGEDFFETSAQELREALLEIKEIYGAFDNDKILDQTFENFCIGKSIACLEKMDKF